jgi:hypothetical protein
MSKRKNRREAIMRWVIILIAVITIASLSSF